MFIIDCLPFSKGLNKEALSYFSSASIEPGSLIKVSLRGKKVNALVIQSREARNMKAEIKSSNFQLKKVFSFVSKPFLSKPFLNSVRDTSAFFAVTEGALLSAIIPSNIIENPNLLYRFKEEKKPTKEAETTSNTKKEVAAIQTEEDERFLNYRSLIREEFAKNKSLFFCLPQNEYVLQTKERLERGIETFVATFHRDMGKAEFKAEWTKATNPSHPVVIIGTARWLSIGREDLSTVVVEKENESGWQTLSRPFIDLRYFAERFAQHKNAKIIFGDSFLRIDTLHRYKEGEITTFENVKWRMPGDTENLIIDLRKTQKNQEEFRAISKEALDIIRENSEKGSHTFVFAARKGLAPLTLCRDCGEEVKCLNCSAPMILYHKKKSGEEIQGIFRCHQCGETRSAAEYCQNCGSWKLSPFGAGADKIALEIREKIEKAPIHELNKDLATTPSKAQRIVENFYEDRGAILIGTEMAFNYLNKKVGASVIASFDSLFSIPDFRINEKIFRIITETRNLTKRKFLVQSRHPEYPAVTYALSGNIAAFYEQEIKDRKILNYPPFSMFIKITARGTKSFVEKEMARLSKTLEPLSSEFSGGKTEVAIFNSIHEKKGEAAGGNAVIKILKGEFLEPEIIETLRSLPPHFEIKVNPDSLL